MASSNLYKDGTRMTSANLLFRESMRRLWSLFTIDLHLRIGLLAITSTSSKSDHRVEALLASVNPAIKLNKEKILAIQVDRSRLVRLSRTF